MTVPVIELPRLAFLVWMGNAPARLLMPADSLALVGRLGSSELRGEPSPGYTFGDTPRTVGRFLHCEEGGKAIYRVTSYDWRTGLYELVWPD